MWDDNQDDVWECYVHTGQPVGCALTRLSLYNFGVDQPECKPMHVSISFLCIRQLAAKTAASSKGVNRPVHTQWLQDIMVPWLQQQLPVHGGSAGF